MEKNRKIRRKWKMVVAIVFVLAVMIGIGLEEEERSYPCVWSDSNL